MRFTISDVQGGSFEGSALTIRMRQGTKPCAPRLRQLSRTMHESQKEACLGSRAFSDYPFHLVSVCGGMNSGDHIATESTRRLKRKGAEYTSEEQYLVPICRALDDKQIWRWAKFLRQASNGGAPGVDNAAPGFLRRQADGVSING
jgi:hypothetical protein